MLLLSGRAIGRRWRWMSVEGKARKGREEKRCRTDYPTKQELKIEDPGEKPIRETYRVLGFDGKLLPGADPNVIPPAEECVEMYKQMVAMNQMDRIGYDVQRQGRISFYMTHFGEEATMIGAGWGLDKEDTIYGQYREAGLLMVRGWNFDNFMNQLYSNWRDVGKGRQMPVHYGSADLKFQTISSPLTTQVPQAAGAAYALKRAGKDEIVACFFGEGAASEGDFHAGMNFAATLAAPVLFFCRNNGYAISTPTKDQYKGDGIVSRADGYGMKNIRVDGNDIFAVRSAVEACRSLMLEKGEPVLLEAMSYRIGHHSTSDESTRYREAEEIAEWQEGNNPILRLRAWLYEQKLWSAEDDASWTKNTKKQVLKALRKAEAEPKPPIKDLFSDVYHSLTPALQKQQQQLHSHLENYSEHYS